MRQFCWLILCLVHLFSCSIKKLPEQNISNGRATVFTEHDKLIISTGKVERTYRLTPYGFATESFRNISSDTEWVKTNPEILCDWSVDGYARGNLVTLSSFVSDDEKFTDTHICVEAEFEYPEKRLMLKYMVWAYPEAEGLRTQIQLKALPGFDSKRERFSTDITETLNFKDEFSEKTAFGYMQGIKTNMDKDILTETELNVDTKTVDWANGLVLASEEKGIVLVKESNKSTSLKKKGDVATGSFLLDENIIRISGAGMFPKNLREDNYLSCWANWAILYSGDFDNALLSLKKFDRRRFPVHPDRDIFMMANTWGSEDMRPGCLYAAREENVLKELESVADLGIDILQIDDGWQTAEWLPAKHSRDHEHKDVIGDYDVYPGGWDKVKEKAKELNVKLGLWAAWVVPTEKLKWNYDKGGFNAFKLDFANLNTIEKRDELMGKARELIKYSNYNTCVNWDVTEIPPRAGYFYGREYGNIYLENRKVTTARPPVQYIPSKVLRDAWLLSKYVNLNKFQVTVQNIDMTKDPTKTDAQLHNHPYVVAIALMSSPIFFQETHYYSEEARKEIKPLLSVYKKHREEMYAGYVFPLGDVPDNKSWTGFQNHNPKTHSGYLTIFRELNNSDTSKKLSLKFLGNKTIRLTDLTTDLDEVLILKDGEAGFTIKNPADFKYFKYEVVLSQK
ncbi:MAG: alpha-galactosidase [Cytophagales bacterium]|nr:alpha-galactosidase [Cytophagales bacterium]